MTEGEREENLAYVSALVCACVRVRVRVRIRTITDASPTPLTRNAADAEDLRAPEEPERACWGKEQGEKRREEGRGAPFIA